MRRIAILLIVGAVALTAALGASASRKDVRLNLVAYSTPREAYAKLTAAFAATPEGKGVSFSQSYGASGEQARAVENGLPSDIVALSLEPDVTQLVKKGLVKPNWNRNKYNGMVTDSVVVFVVRKGNPKKIVNWSDLARPGIQVVTPNPFTSGGARWNVMAAYGAQIEQGKSEADAEAYLDKLFHNVPVQDKSARDALTTFTNGKGDVLLAYENEAKFAQLKGQELFYVIPRSTLLIENPIAVTTTAKGDNLKTATAFLKYLHTEPAQRIFAQNGYRPLAPALVKEFKFPSRPGLFDIKFLGGWDKVTTAFFDPDKGVMARIEREVGGSTG
jgi:sulfate/thiosulfate-binding protein